MSYDPDIIARLTPSDVRLICTHRELMKRMGLDLPDYFQAVRKLRIAYFRHVHTHKYLADLLGKHGGHPISSCKLFDSQNKIIPSPDDSDKKLIIYLRKHFNAETMPERIEISHQNKTIEICL